MTGFGNKVIRITPRSVEPLREHASRISVSKSGRVYGLVWRVDDPCGTWAVVELSGATRPDMVCATPLDTSAQPQHLYVSADESVIAVVFMEEEDFFGDPRHIAVFVGDDREPSVYRGATPFASRLHYSPVTDALYSVDLVEGTVVELSLASGERTVLVPPRTTDYFGDSLFLIDGTLFANRRDEAAGTSTVTAIDVATKERREYTFPGAMEVAFEHGGYIMLRDFTRTAEDTFVGFCASSPERYEVFRVALPPFARERGPFAHTRSCEQAPGARAQRA